VDHSFSSSAQVYCTLGPQFPRLISSHAK
jgi:hypothetical protein